MKTPKQFQKENEFIDVIADRYFAPEQCSFSHAFEVAVFHKGRVLSRNTAFRRIAAMAMVDREIIKKRSINKKAEKSLLDRFKEVSSHKDLRMALVRFNSKNFQRFLANK
ncbi:TPA: hypothetical protein NKV05_003146 [Vibrio parahaemolyticus]|nr:hypothetical protein [Vibrio parahaemolyticus]